MLTFSDVLCNDLDATVYRNLKFSIYTMSKTDCNFSPIPIKLGNAVSIIYTYVWFVKVHCSLISYAERLYLITNCASDILSTRLTTQIWC